MFFREQRLEIKNEIAVRNKALADPNFPNEKLISEYLVRKDDVKKLNLKWKQPNLVAFVVSRKMCIDQWSSNCVP